jgi:hypothetical protein
MCMMIDFRLDRMVWAHRAVTHLILSLLTQSWQGTQTVTAPSSAANVPVVGGEHVCLQVGHPGHPSAAAVKEERGGWEIVVASPGGGSS